MTANRVKIRVAVSDDIPLITELDSIARHDSRRRTFIEIATTSAQCWLATENNDEASILGYGVLNQTFFEQNFVPLIFVRESARRKGVASAILHKLESTCPGAKLFTSTNSSNAPMRALLVQGGYAASGYVENLDEGDPELIFVKLVTA